MECMCAQTRPRFILSSERVFGATEFEPMLTPREKSPIPENFPRGGSNPRRCGQRAQTLPTSYSSPLAKHSISQLVGWPVSGMASLSTSQSISQSVSQSISKPVSQSISKPVSQSISQPVSQSISQPVNQSVSQSVNQSVSQSVKQSVSPSVSVLPVLCPQRAVLAQVGRDEDVTSITFQDSRETYHSFLETMQCRSRDIFVVDYTPTRN